MKLKCIGRYVNMARGLVYEIGTEFEPDDELATFLLADAPGCFKEVKPRRKRRKQVKEPPKDKQVKEAEEK